MRSKEGTLGAMMVDGRENKWEAEQQRFGKEGGGGGVQQGEKETIRRPRIGLEGKSLCSVGVLEP